jgi:glycosyltransferase involved in cell wall biosynthesis
LRITHIKSNFQPSDGGPTSALIGLAIAQKSLGLDVRIVWTARHGDPLASQIELEAAGVAVVRIENCRTSYRFSFQMAKKLREVIEVSDVVHLHGVFEHVHWVAARECVKLNVPYVLRPCGMLANWTLRQRWLKKFIFLRLFGQSIIDRASLIHLSTELEKSELGVRVRSGQIVIEPNGVQIPTWEWPQTGNGRADTVGQFQASYCVFVGRLHRIKGIERIIEALGRLKAEALTVVIIGSGEAEYQRELELLAQRFGVSHLVNFIGAKFGKERDAIVHDAEYLLLPSSHENFANVVIESLALGTPAIVSEQVGLASFVREHQLGLVCQPSAESLAAAMHEFQLAESRASFRDRAKRIITERFSWPLVAQNWLGHYRRLNSKK